MTVVRELIDLSNELVAAVRDRDGDRLEELLAARTGCT